MEDPSQLLVHNTLSTRYDLPTAKCSKSLVQMRSYVLDGVSVRPPLHVAGPDASSSTPLQVGRLSAPECPDYIALSCTSFRTRAFASNSLRAPEHSGRTSDGQGVFDTRVAGRRDLVHAAQAGRVLVEQIRVDDLHVWRSNARLLCTEIEMGWQLSVNLADGV